MSGAILIVATFIAGNAWGPAISTAVLPSPAACESTQKFIASQIIEMAKTNIAGGADAQEKDGQLIIIAAGAARREIARLSCQ